MPFRNAKEVSDNFRLNVTAAEVYFSISSKNYYFLFSAWNRLSVYYLH